MQFIKNGSILLEIDEVVESNHAMVMFGSALAIRMFTHAMVMVGSTPAISLIGLYVGTIINRSLESVLVGVPQM